MKKILGIISALLIFISCSNSTKIKTQTLVEKYSLDKVAAQNWERTISEILQRESDIPEWFGNENPLLNLRRHGKMTDKDLYFLEALAKIEPSKMTDDDYNKFLELLTTYVNKLPRKFFLDNTNIKDPKGLIEYMIKSANSQIDTPSKYIKEVVADKEEWNKIIVLSQKEDLNEKDVKVLRKLLNNFIKREDFFNEKVWFNQEISERVLQLKELNKRYPKTKIEENNINAKALYIAYPGFFSPLDRWDR